MPIQPIQNSIQNNLQNNAFQQKPADDKLHPFISSMFKPSGTVVTNPNPTIHPNTYINKGSLISFNYTKWKHDPYPLVLITDITPGVKLRGVNLHYMTFNSIKNIIKNSCSNPGFSYSNIRGDKYIISAFRSYEWASIRQIKRFDCNVLLNIMATVRNYDPSESKAIREAVQQQLKQVVNTKADSMTTNPATPNVAQPTTPINQTPTAEANGQGLTRQNN